MNAGEKAIAKEMRRQEQERRKQLQLANKMLIPVSKKTSVTLEMISFDPSGVFFLNENRWLKIFTLEGDIEKSRRYYNGTVRENNILVDTFPSNIIANMFKFTKSAFFELDNIAERIVPSIKF